MTRGSVSPDLHRLVPVSISINGDVGSGKSTVAKALSSALDWPLISTGGIFRQIAARHEMSVMELNRYARGRDEIDQEVDDHLRDLALSGASVVVDSRMAWHFLPSSFKVYLVVDPLVAGERLFRAARSDERYPSSDAAASEAKKRQDVETVRYNDLYGVQADSWRNYDLVIDGTLADPDALASTILAVAALPHADRNALECWLAPTRLLPTQPIESLDPTPTGSLVDGERSGVAIVAHRDTYVVVDGHGSLARALAEGSALARCDVRALGIEEVCPGVRASDYVLTALSDSVLRGWEQSFAVSYAARQV